MIHCEKIFHITNIYVNLEVNTMGSIKLTTTSEVNYCPYFNVAYKTHSLCPQSTSPGEGSSGVESMRRETLIEANLGKRKLRTQPNQTTFEAWVTMVIQPCKERKTWWRWQLQALRSTDPIQLPVPLNLRGQHLPTTTNHSSLLVHL